VWGIAALTLLCIGLAIGTETWWLMGVPTALLVVWVAIVDFRLLFFPMLAGIPISTEIELPGGLGTDLPSEPLMWLLTLTSGLWLLRHAPSLDARFVRHPISILLLLHLAWTTLCVAASEDIAVSIKFWLAKVWYLAVFYCLAARVLRTEQDYRRAVWWFFGSLLFTVVTVLVRHAPAGFSFSEVNYVLSPFYRNHVMYACLMAVFLPFVWYATHWYRRWSLVWWLLVLGIVTLVVGINFAYTRAAYGALVAAIGMYWLMRWRLLQAGLIAATLLIGLFVGFVTYRDNYLLFAPDYERTITHARFESLLEATTRLEDVSIMERVYRWVAAANMIQDKPLLGFGPGNFYFFYKNYTVNSFQTYVSDNPERSGMHNYYLMLTVEQGIPGMLIFVGMCYFVMLCGQRIFHRTRVRWRQHMATAALLCFMLIVMLMLMNDFVETDKIGSLFFICLAILVNLDLENESPDSA
jgi:O-antigen ligase